METKKFDLDKDKTQSLDEWITEIMFPVLEAIGYISEYLEGLYQELK